MRGQSRTALLRFEITLLKLLIICVLHQTNTTEEIFEYILLTNIFKHGSVGHVIESFGDPQTELIWNGEFSRRLPPTIQEAALTKLRLLNAAVRLENLSATPGNKLESLNGERKGQHSIRINRQWRVCFRWNNGGAQEVEIVDYH